MNINENFLLNLTLQQRRRRHLALIWEVDVAKINWQFVSMSLANQASQLSDALRKRHFFRHNHYSLQFHYCRLFFELIGGNLIFIHPNCYKKTSSFSSPIWKPIINLFVLSVILLVSNCAEVRGLHRSGKFLFFILFS